jgi:hypothetical protein
MSKDQVVYDLTNTIDHLQKASKFGVGCEAVCLLCKRKARDDDDDDEDYFESEHHLFSIKN